jgi:uncharacterized protein with HEPN domain
MTEPLLRSQDCLAHIAEAIERIGHYTEDVDELGFSNSELIQDAVIRNIEIIGEAANNIRKHEPDFARQHDEVPWEVLYAMRNRVSHGYFRVDLEIIWKTIQNDLAELYAQVKNLMRQAS